jgi:hypothetical protein
MESNLDNLGLVLGRESFSYIVCYSCIPEFGIIGGKELTFTSSIFGSEFSGCLILGSGSILKNMLSLMDEI